jgi:xanthine/uracil permease
MYHCFKLRVCFSNAAEAILLGFQHYLVMLGTTVLIPTSLVPQMGGGNVSLDKDNNNWTPALLFLVFVSGIWMFPYYIGCDP